MRHGRNVKPWQFHMEIIGVSFINELFLHFPQTRRSKQLSSCVSGLSLLIKGLSTVGLGVGWWAVRPDILNQGPMAGPLTVFNQPLYVEGKVVPQKIRICKMGPRSLKEVLHDGSAATLP